jgi:hypothetical protein
MIWDWHSFGREEEDKEDEGNGSPEKNNDKGMMTTTNNFSGHERRNAKGWWNRNIIVIGQQWRWHGRTSRWLPPRPIVGQHHSWEERCGSEMLLSCGDANAADIDGENEDG